MNAYNVNSSSDMHKLPLIMLVILIILVTSINFSFAQPNVILGPTCVQTNTSYSYSMPSISPTYSGTKTWVWTISGGLFPENGSTTISGTEKRGVGVIWTSTGAKSISVVIQTTTISSVKNNFGGSLPAPLPNVSERCGPGTVIINAMLAPGTPPEAIIRWYDTETSSTVLATGSTYNTTVTSSRSFYATAYANGCNESPRVNVPVTIKSLPITPEAIPASSCGPASVTLAVSAGGQEANIKWYSSANGGSANQVGTGGSYVTPVLSTTTNYYAVNYNPSTQCYQDGPPVPVTATITPVGVPQGTNGSRCGAGSVTLSAEPGNCGNTVRWYSTISSTTVLATGLSFPTPSLTTSRTYFISTYNSTKNTESPANQRVPVLATINPVPNVASPKDGKRCGAGSVILSGTPGANGNTLRWYTASSGGTLLATALEYSVSSTVTLFIATYNTSTQCESSRVPVSAIVQPEPGTPSGTGASRCGSGSVILSAVAGTNGNVVRWYSAETGGSPTTGDTFTTPSLTVTTTYYITSYNTTTLCETSQRTPVIATINPEPGPPPSIMQSPSNLCGPGSVTLSSMPSPDATVRWYTLSTGGVPFHTGNSYSTTLSVTTTFYINSYNLNTNCERSGPRIPITVYVHPVPGAPTPIDGSRCGSGSITLTSTPGTNANSLKWYNALTGGTLLATGLTYPTPGSDNTTSYYITSYSTTTGCESTGPRQKVFAIINQVPADPTSEGASRCGSGSLELKGNPGTYGNSIKWYDKPTQGSVLHTGIFFTTPVLSVPTTYYITTFNTSSGCESIGTRIPVVADIKISPGIPTVVDGHRCGPGTVILSATPGLNGSTVNWYASASSSTPFFTGLSYTTAELSVNATYYVTTANSTGCESDAGAKTPITAYIHAIPGEPSASDVSRCGPGTVALTATGGANANTIRWYDVPSGGTPVATTTNFVTPALTGNTTYYISSYNSTTGCESEGARKLVNVTIHPDPALPLTADVGRCGPGTITLSATPGAEGNVVRWYSASTGGTLLSSGNSFTTPSLTVTTTYFVSSYNSITGCESSLARIPVVAVINPVPTAPLAIGAARYGPGEVTLVSVPGSNATKTRWYTTLTGGSPIAENTHFTTPALSANATYYISSYNSETTCESTAARLAVQAFIHPALTGTSYRVDWTETINTVVKENNSLQKTVPGTAWDASAASKNILKASQNGWIEFTVASSNALYFMAGLSRLNNDVTYQTTDYAVYLSGSTTIRIYELGTLRTSHNVNIGDRIRIERIGSNIVYSRNGLTLRTLAITGSYNLRADVSLLSGFMPEITCSFDQELSIKPSYVFPAYNNTGGSISVEVEGGTPPYTYSWASPESATNTISNISRGMYTVTVSDAVGRTVTKTFRLGFEVAWNKLEKVTVNQNNSLSRDESPRAWDGNASSLNIIPAGASGELEFVYSDVGSYYMVGISSTDIDASYTSIDHAIYIRDGWVYMYESGDVKGNIYSAARGDVFRISKTASYVYYFQNTTLLRTVAVNVLKPFLIDVAVNGGTVPVINTSFEKALVFKPSFTFPSNENVGGAINLDVTGAYGSVSYAWSPGGEQTEDIANKTRGTYSITATDGNGLRSTSQSYYLGYPVVWNEVQNSSVSTDNSLIKTVPGNSWDACAISAAQLSPGLNGSIQFIVNDASSGQFMLGLARPNSVAHHNSIDYAFYIHPNGEVNIRELGVHVKLAGFLREGDVFKIERTGAIIKYFRNGVELRSIATTTSYTLVVDASIYAGKLPVVATSFNRLPQTFHAIASGLWTDSNIWSLAEGGSPGSLYPAKGDIVNIKGYTVTVQTGIYTSDINIIATNGETCLKVEGADSSLNVFGQIFMRGMDNASAVKSLIVQNEAKINIVNPN